MAVIQGVGHADEGRGLVQGLAVLLAQSGETAVAHGGPGLAVITDQLGHQGAIFGQQGQAGFGPVQILIRKGTRGRIMAAFTYVCGDTPDLLVTERAGSEFLPKGGASGFIQFPGIAHDRRSKLALAQVAAAGLAGNGSIGKVQGVIHHLERDARIQPEIGQRLHPPRVSPRIQRAQAAGCAQQPARLARHHLDVFGLAVRT